jgi:antitoxin HigA-1
MMPKRRSPTHPGKVLEEEFLMPLNMTVRDLAHRLGPQWTEKQIDELIKGEHSISDGLAQGLSSVFDTTPDFWIHLQQFYHEWEAIHKQNEKGALKPWKTRKAS